MWVWGNLRGGEADPNQRKQLQSPSQAGVRLSGLQGKSERLATAIGISPIKGATGTSRAWQSASRGVWGGGGPPPAGPDCWLGLSELHISTLLCLAAGQFSGCSGPRAQACLSNPGAYVNQLRSSEPRRPLHCLLSGSELDWRGLWASQELGQKTAVLSLIPVCLQRSLQ